MYLWITYLIGIEQARRDDVESLGYVFLYFLRGSLPWQGMRARNVKDKYEKIKEKKILTKIEDLSRGFPEEFHQYINYTRRLKFNEKPDYSHLRSLFKNLFTNLQFDHDYAYDWTFLKEDHKKKDDKKKNRKK